MVKEATELIWLLATGVASSGTTAVGLAGVMDVSSPGGNVINESTLIPLGLFLAGLAMTTTVVWKAASQKVATDMKLKELIDRVERLERLRDKET